MRLAVTGHRPNKLGGYSDKAASMLRGFAIDELHRYVGQKDLKVFTGMALGWDQAIAVACLHLDLPFIAHLPCNNQECKWPQQSKAAYRLLLERAESVVVVSPGPYAAWKMQRRNQAMVDDCQELLALWNGSPGGTANCIEYAESRFTPPKITNPWEKWQRRIELS